MIKLLHVQSNSTAVLKLQCGVKEYKHSIAIVAKMCKHVAEEE
jgi:hypothetical protein